MKSKPLILASGSQYRAEQLSQLGLSFMSIAPDIDESPLNGEAFAARALRLAEAKTMAIARSNPSAIIIGGDQTAECDGQNLGKPGSREAALRQLQLMRGKSAIFYSAVHIYSEMRTFSHVETTQIDMKALSDEALLRYLDLDNPYDCAGSFKIERAGIALFSKVISNDPSALTGLPLIAVCQGLSMLGLTIP